jgi:hypothetical protein
MIPASGFAGIRIDAKPGLPLQAGEYVSLKVIKRIMGNKWALGLKGQVLAARSEIELIPGETIRAQVSSVGRQIFFKINSKPENRLETFIVQSGLELDAVSKNIVAAMLRSGLTLDPAMIQRIRELLVRHRGRRNRLARIIAMIFDKNLAGDSSAFTGLIELLEFGEEGSENRGQGREQRQQRSKKESPGSDELVRLIKERVNAKPGAQNDLLQLFNHYKSNNDNWLIIPYNFETGGSLLSGTLRLLYDPYGKVTRRIVLIVNVDEGSRWSFLLQRRDSKSRLHVFCNREKHRRSGNNNLAKLQAKLQNLGVEVDDTIGEDGAFDGFSLPCEVQSFKRIDTLG